MVLACYMDDLLIIFREEKDFIKNDEASGEEYQQVAPDTRWMKLVFNFRLTDYAQNSADVFKC